MVFRMNLAGDLARFLDIKLHHHLSWVQKDDAGCTLLLDIFYSRLYDLDDFFRILVLGGQCG